MFKKLINLLSIVLILGVSTSVYANEEFELFDRLKDDMWQMGLDFDYVHSVDFKVPNQGAAPNTQADHENVIVKSVPYDLIQRFERTF